MSDDNARTITCSVCGCSVRGVCAHLGLAELSDALADVGRLTRERDEARRECERWRHGVQIESDYVCPDSLRADSAERERDDARAVLRDVEWSGPKVHAGKWLRGTYPHTMVPTCPMCGAKSIDCHALDCALARALGSGRKGDMSNERSALEWALAEAARLRRERDEARRERDQWSGIAGRVNEQAIFAKADRDEARREIADWARGAGVLAAERDEARRERDIARDVLRRKRYREIGPCSALVCIECGRTIIRGCTPDCALARALGERPERP